MSPRANAASNPSSIVSRPDPSGRRAGHRASAHGPAGHDPAGHGPPAHGPAGHGATVAALQGELEESARALEAQRYFIQHVIDALPVGLYVVDRDYRVQAWNHTRETGLQGIARGEAIGRTIFEILHRQSAESLRREFDDVFTTGAIRQYETRTSGSEADGRPPRSYRISKISMRLGGGDITHVITVGEDVTAWKETQARVAQAEKLAAIGQLAAGVMHEINNPLATIAACAESMALNVAPGSDPAGVPVAQHAEYLSVIEAEVRRCQQIVDALLNFGRTRPVARSVVALNGIVEQTLFLLKHHARFKQRTVRLALDATAGVVFANGEQLVQVLMALLHNAADAVDARPAAPGPAARGATDGTAGGITVRTRRVVGGEDGGVVIVEVIDEGVGIPPRLREKIFEPFYTTKPPGRGTGLGLSVCYGIITDHGGRLDVESEVGIGSTFRVVLPDAAAMGPDRSDAGAHT